MNIKSNKFNLILILIMIISLSLAVGCGGGGGSSTTGNTNPTITSDNAATVYSGNETNVNNAPNQAPSAAVASLNAAIAQLEDLNSAAGSSNAPALEASNSNIRTSTTNKKYDFTDLLKNNDNSWDKVKLNINNLLAVANTYLAQAYKNQGSSTPTAAVLKSPGIMSAPDYFTVQRQANRSAADITSALNKAKKYLDESKKIADATTEVSFKVVAYVEVLLNITKIDADPTISQSEQLQLITETRTKINTELSIINNEIKLSANRTTTTEFKFVEKLNIEHPVKLEAKIADVTRKIDPGLAEKISDEVKEKIKNEVSDLSDNVKTSLQKSLDMTKALAVISNPMKPIEEVRSNIEALNAMVKEAQASPATATNVTINVNIKIEIVATIVVMVQTRTDVDQIKDANLDFAGANVNVDNFKDSSVVTQIGGIESTDSIVNNLTNTVTDTKAVNLVGGTGKTLADYLKNFYNKKYQYELKKITLAGIDEFISQYGYNDILNEVTGEINLRADCYFEYAKIYFDRFNLSSDEVNLDSAAVYLEKIINGEVIDPINGFDIDYSDSSNYYAAKEFYIRITDLKNKLKYQVTSGQQQLNQPVFSNKISIIPIKMTPKTVDDIYELSFRSFYTGTPVKNIAKMSIAIPAYKQAGSDAIGLYQEVSNTSEIKMSNLKFPASGIYDIIVTATAENEFYVRAFSFNVTPRPVLAISSAVPVLTAGVSQPSQIAINFSREVMPDETFAVEIYKNGEFIKTIKYDNSANFAKLSTGSYTYNFASTLSGDGGYYLHMIKAYDRNNNLVSIKTYEYSAVPVAVNVPNISITPDSTAALVKYEANKPFSLKYTVKCSTIENLVGVKEISLKINELNEVKYVVNNVSEITKSYPSGLAAGSYNVSVAATAEVRINAVQTQLVSKQAVFTITVVPEIVPQLAVMESDFALIPSYTNGTYAAELNMRMKFNRVRELNNYETIGVWIYRNDQIVKIDNKELLTNADFNKETINGLYSYYRLQNPAYLKDSNGNFVYGKYLIKVMASDRGTVIFTKDYTFNFVKPTVSEGGVTYTESDLLNMMAKAKFDFITALKSNDIAEIMKMIDTESVSIARPFFTDLLAKVNVTDVTLDTASTQISIISSAIYKVPFYVKGTFKANAGFDGYKPAEGSIFENVQSNMPIYIDLLFKRYEGKMYLKHTFIRRNYISEALKELSDKFKADVKNKFAAFDATGIYKDETVFTGVKKALVNILPNISATSEIMITDINAPVVNNNLVTLRQKITSDMFSFTVSIKAALTSGKWLIDTVYVESTFFDFLNVELKQLDEFVYYLSHIESTVEAEVFYNRLKTKYVETYKLADTHELLITLNKIYDQYKLLTNEEAANQFEENMMVTQNSLFLNMRPDYITFDQSSVDWNNNIIALANDKIKSDPADNFMNGILPADKKVTGYDIKSAALKEDNGNYYVKVDLNEKIYDDLKKYQLNVSFGQCNMNGSSENIINTRVNPFNSLAKSSFISGQSYTFASNWSVDKPLIYVQRNFDSNITSYQIKIPKTSIIPEGSKNRADILDKLSYANRNNIFLSVEVLRNDQNLANVPYYNYHPVDSVYCPPLPAENKVNIIFYYSNFKNYNGAYVSTFKVTDLDGNVISALPQNAYEQGMQQAVSVELSDSKKYIFANFYSNSGKILYSKYLGSIPDKTEFAQLKGSAKALLFTYNNINIDHQTTAIAAVMRDILKSDKTDLKNMLGLDVRPMVHYENNIAFVYYDFSSSKNNVSFEKNLMNYAMFVPGLKGLVESLATAVGIAAVSLNDSAVLLNRDMVSVENILETLKAINDDIAANQSKKTTIYGEISLPVIELGPDTNKLIFDFTNNAAGDIKGLVTVLLPFLNDSVAAVNDAPKVSLINVDGQTGYNSADNPATVLITDATDEAKISVVLDKAVNQTITNIKLRIVSVSSERKYNTNSQFIEYSNANNNYQWDNVLEPPVALNDGKTFELKFKPNGLFNMSGGSYNMKNGETLTCEVEVTGMIAGTSAVSIDGIGSKMVVFATKPYQVADNGNDTGLIIKGKLVPFDNIWGVWQNASLALQDSNGYTIANTVADSAGNFEFKWYYYGAMPSERLNNLKIIAYYANKVLLQRYIGSIVVPKDKFINLDNVIIDSKTTAMLAAMPTMPAQISDLNFGDSGAIVLAGNSKLAMTNEVLTGTGYLPFDVKFNELMAQNVIDGAKFNKLLTAVQYIHSAIKYNDEAINRAILFNGWEYQNNYNNPANNGPVTAEEIISTVQKIAKAVKDYNLKVIIEELGNKFPGFLIGNADIEIIKTTDVEILQINGTAVASIPEWNESWSSTNPPAVQPFEIFGDSFEITCQNALPDGITSTGNKLMVYGFTQGNSTPVNVEVAVADTNWHANAVHVVFTYGQLTQLAGFNGCMMYLCGSNNVQISKKYYVNFKNNFNFSALIPALNTGVKYSATFLKPGSDMTRIGVVDFSTTESMVIVPYNTISESSYSMSITSVTMAAPQYFTSMVAASPSKSPSIDSYSGQSLWDQKMREMERKTIKDFGVSSSARSPLLKAPAKAPVLGEITQFGCNKNNNWPPTVSDYTTVEAKLVAIGTHCYIYEDQNIPNGFQALTSGEINAFQSNFDTVIYPTDTATFGSEQQANDGIDGDPRIYILFTHNVNDISASGYFSALNQIKQSELDSNPEYNKNSSYYYYSNQKEIFFIGVPTPNFNGERYQNDANSTLAHEFQHMINYNMRVTNGVAEEEWVDEGLAQVAEDACGYGYHTGANSHILNAFLSSFGSYSLLKHERPHASYGFDYLFVRYLIDRGVTPKDLLNTNLVGVANVEARLKEKNIAENFTSFYAEFLTAVLVSNRGCANSDSDKYKFKSVNLKSGSVQADNTTLNEITLTSGSPVIPCSYNGVGLKNYGFNVIKCTNASAGTNQISLNSLTNSGIGAVILRIKN